MCFYFRGVGDEKQCILKMKKGKTAIMDTEMSNSFIKRTIKKAKDQKRIDQLLILVSFLLTFVFIRTITHLQKAGIIPNQHGGFHLHHMVPGIIFLLISGYTGLSFWSNETLRRYMSILFGIGAALTIDEFALWLFLQDVYWAKRGRDSVDAVIITIVLLSIGYILSALHDHNLVKKLIKK